MVATTPGLASVTYTGIPYGPFGLWTLNKLLYGPAPFTASHNYINADSLVLQINAARAKGHRLMTAMTGGATAKYVTNGNFDLAKWKAVMNGYNKSALKTAVAAAVADGTIIGNSMVDEPETKKWGTTMTKPGLSAGGQAAKLKDMQTTLQNTLRHHPVVLEQQAQRAQDVQLRIADRITAFAGSMQFAYLTSWYSPSGCCSSSPSHGRR